MKQLPLPFAPHQSYAAADLVPDASNAAALAWLAEPARWPLGRLALHGPAGIGKTHMLHATAARFGWPLLAVAELRGLPPPPTTGLVLDDADQAPDETALFHLVNLCAEAGQPLLLAGRQPPARWPVRLPDLASRLRATTAAAVEPPSDALLAQLLEKHFADRQLRTEPGFRAWLLPRLPRAAAAIAEAAARLDRAGLAAGGPLTRSLARACLASLLHPAPLFDEQDDYVTGPAPPSPERGPLL
jgi:chromosomal replication initiation ATPase DnaA